MNKHRKFIYFAVPGAAMLLLSGMLLFHIGQTSSNSKAVSAKYEQIQSQNKIRNNEMLDLNSDNISKKLSEQGILGTDLNQKKQYMNQIIKKNMNIAYSAKITKDIKKISNNEFSTTLIDNLVEKDSGYSDGSYANKDPKLMREGIKNIEIQYGKYDINSGNIMAVVNINYKRFSIFNKAYDGGEQAPANDTYILKCNLKSNFVDLITYYPAVMLNPNGNDGGGLK